MSRLLSKAVNVFLALSVILLIGSPLQVDPGTRVASAATFGPTTEFIINAGPAPGSGQGPVQIVNGPDGNLWFDDLGLASPVMDRMTTGGAITRFNVPLPAVQITDGPDGALWFIDSTQQAIDRLTTSGLTSVFPIQSFAAAITSGPDGNLWFTSFSGISRMTTTGSITQFPIPPELADPLGITPGPRRQYLVH